MPLRLDLLSWGYGAMQTDNLADGDKGRNRRVFGKYVNLELLLVLLLVAILLIAGAQVFGRYLFSAPLPWAEELTRILLVWLVFLGAADAIRTRTHIRLEAIDRSRKKWLKKSSRLIIASLMVIIVSVCLYQGANWLKIVKGSTPALGIDIRVKYAALPASMLLACWYILRQFFKKP